VVANTNDYIKVPAFLNGEVTLRPRPGSRAKVVGDRR
jgi:hypothetical protein